MVLAMVIDLPPNGQSGGLWVIQVIQVIWLVIREIQMLISAHSESF